MKHKRVLITGAANGIGACIAAEFAHAGADLVLFDVDGEGLRNIGPRLQTYGARVWPYYVNVANRQMVEQTAERVLSVHGGPGGIDVIINNAGIGHHGTLVDTDMATWRRLFDVNFWGALNVTYAFLPRMLEQGHGRVVNVSSGQAFFRLPTWGAYTCTKLALAAFSEVLHYELRGSGVKVTTVYPFMVNTGFYDGVEGESLGARLSMKLLPFYSHRPETVGRLVYQATMKGKRVEMVSVLNRLGHLMDVTPLKTVVGRASNWALAKKKAV